ncbi:hypothetical protein CG747_32255 [Streptomyces sp. CB02959]|uniref:hypothetical protein n=1 Tax=Streptomyces sp. CB02959 TaxID=2020330 RepID=UPI000C2715C7|nr:hypothetical protein [Streptomyces sp. CB02959]PJN36612.1 hypothetical protein CG747_32255 [Streptomyces sp. CB02959]
MANTTTRRRRKPAPAPKPRGAGRTKTTTPPAAVPEGSVPRLFEEAAPVLADAADRAADLRDLAADDAARILADSEARAAELLEGARSVAATITKAATTEQARVLADAQADADRVRTDAATTAAVGADQVLADADAKAKQLLADARTAADTVTATASGEADQVLAAAEEDAEQLLAAARHQAQDVTTTAAAQADTVQAQADQVLADAEGQRTELLAAAERTAAETRIRAAEEAEKVRAEAVAGAEQQLRAARSEAAQLREDASRERETATADAARARKLAEEDVARLRATSAEDAERTARTARAEAARLLAEAKEKNETDLKEAEAVLARARTREGEADEALAEANARMQSATSRTEKALARKRLKHQARQERRDENTARKAKAREARDARRAGQPTQADRIKKFVKVNAERLMVVGPITAPMAVAWTGQAGFAKDILGWVVPFTILFAAAWELSTAFVGWMYHQARRGGDAGTLYRASTWVFAIGAAVMNFWHASGERVPGSRAWDATAQKWTEQITYWHFTPKAVAFAAMSIVGMVLWELYASLIHRRKLREDGKVAKARPTIGAVRWVRYPVHSFTAWSLAITDASLTTLDRVWTAAGAQLADRKAVRTGRALHRVVVPRVRTDDHGPAAIPTVLTITRMDRPGPAGNHSLVRPVQHDRSTVRSGPNAGFAVHGPVHGPDRADRTAAGALALESGPTDRIASDLHGRSGPDRSDRKTRAVSAAHGSPAARSVTVRTEAPGRTGPLDGPEDHSGPASNRETNSGPDRTVITLTDLERTALDRLRSEDRPLNRTNIAAAVRSEGGSIATDRAGQIAVALKQHTVH